MEQFPVAGDVAQLVQAPVTGMLPFGGLSVCPITSPQGPCLVVSTSTLSRETDGNRISKSGRGVCSLYRFFSAVFKKKKK